MTTRARSDPKWDVINARLEKMGLRDPDGGVMRSARATFCSGCRRPVMAGLDDDICALSVRCDPAALTAYGEAMAMLGGRRTYSLTFRGGRYEIDRRDQFRIEGAPAGCTPGMDVLVEHDCNIISEFPSIPSAVPLPYSCSADLPLDPPY